MLALILILSKSGKFPLRIRCEGSRSTSVDCLRLSEGKGLPEPEIADKQQPQQQTVSRSFMQQNAKTHIDVGFAVRQKMSEQGTTIAWLAQQINFDRSNLRKHLHHKHIYPELLLKISIALKTDFFAPYSSMVKQAVKNNQENNTLEL